MKRGMIEESSPFMSCLFLDLEVSVWQCKLRTIDLGVCFLPKPEDTNITELYSQHQHINTFYRKIYGILFLFVFKEQQRDSLTFKSSSK